MAKAYCVFSPSYVRWNAGLNGGALVSLASLAYRRQTGCQRGPTLALANALHTRSMLAFTVVALKGIS
jgi:hypothetical protein